MYYLLVWWDSKLYARRWLFLNTWVERGMIGINECWTKDKNQIKQLVSRGIWVLVVVLVEYGSSENRLMIWEKVDWMVCNTCNVSIFCVWAIKNQWLWVSPAIIVHSLRKNGEIKQYQSSQYSLTSWYLDTAWTGKFLR